MKKSKKQYLFHLYLFIELQMVMNFKWTTWQRRIKSLTSFNSWFSRVPSGSTLILPADFTGYSSLICILDSTFGAFLREFHFSVSSKSSSFIYWIINVRVDRLTWFIDDSPLLDSSFDLFTKFSFDFPLNHLFQFNSAFTVNCVN